MFNHAAAIAFAAVLISSCGAGAGVSDEVVTATTTTIPTRPSTAPDPSALRLGQQTETREGNVVRILSYEQPVASALLEPEPGMEYAAAEVEICAGRSGARRTTAEAFTLEMADGSRRGRSFFGPREPALADARLAPGACARGWVNFEVPKGKRPAYVTFAGSSVARWAAGGPARSGR